MVLKRAMFGVVLSGLLLACGDAAVDGQGGGGGCAEITGNYSVMVTNTGGNCGEGTSETSITIGNDGSGFYVLVPGLEGACPANLDESSCRFTANCKVSDKADPNKTIATYSMDYTFSGATFSGSLVGAITSGPDACESQVTHEGTRL